MSIRKPFCALILFGLLICLLAAAALAAEPDAAFTVELPTSGEAYVSIAPQRVGNDVYLFLPAAAQLDALTLRFDGVGAVLYNRHGTVNVASGEPVSLSALCPAGRDSWVLTFADSSVRCTFKLMRSDALRAAFITSADAEKGREYVDADKGRKVKDGAFTLLRADGSVVWDGTLKNIKSRGNSTWKYPKKPYQIKLSEKADLLETGDKAEKESTWILLANYIDESLLHNQITFDLGTEFSLAYTPHSTSVDLYYDGEYRGVYALCEKTEISSGRVAIHDLEKDIEAANPYVTDMDSFPAATGRLDSGLTYQYTEGLDAPEELSGGYLLELDYPDRAQDEAAWFDTSYGQYVAVKSPEYLPEEAMRYISALYERFERAVLAGGVDPETGADYRELVDLDSLSRLFLLMDFAEDNDAFLSSTFFYKPENEEKLYAGPLWDFDTAYGASDLVEAGGSVSGSSLLGYHLLCIPSFREALKERWEELKPLLNDILLSDDPEAAGTSLRPLSAYGAELSASRAMDRVLWGDSAAADADDAVAALDAYLRRRIESFDQQIERWCIDGVVDLYLVDVTPRSWYYDAVHDVLDRGLFPLDSTAWFRPASPMDRATAVTALYRLVGAPETEPTDVFTDVPRTSLYAPAVDWAWSAGVSGGVRSDRFAPGRTITREQFVTMFYRFAGIFGLEPETGAPLSAFSDADAVHDWAQEAMSWAVGSGLIEGNKGRLDPRGQLTRAQAAAILSRFCRLCPDFTAAAEK